MGCARRSRSGISGSGKRRKGSPCGQNILKLFRTLLWSTTAFLCRYVGSLAATDLGPQDVESTAAEHDQHCDQYPNCQQSQPRIVTPLCWYICVGPGNAFGNGIEFRLPISNCAVDSPCFNSLVILYRSLASGDLVHSLPPLTPL